MPTTFMPLQCTRIGSLEQAPQTVYLNPVNVLYGVQNSAGTCLTYLVDAGDIKEYQVTENADAIKTASESVLLPVTPTRFMGVDYKLTDVVLINTALISQIKPAKNPETGAMDYCEVTYSRDRKAIERFVLAQASNTLIIPKPASETGAEPTLNNTETFSI